MELKCLITHLAIDSNLCDIHRLMNRREDEGLTQSASERPVWEKFSPDLKYLHNFFPSLEVCQNSNSPPMSI